MDPLDTLLAALSLEEQVALLTGADFWTTVAVPRLGIPAIKMTDGPNGARGGQLKDGPTTACFPAGIALAASWDIDLLHELGRALAVEASMKGAQVLLAPTVNLHRTALNGRNFECHAEDPLLSGALAVAYIQGVQSQGVAATVKHFVGNESEFQRTTISSDIPERALRELYLVPFEQAVKQAGVMAVMTGYNRLNGRYAADHQGLLQGLLREEWGFDGLVMTDWLARHDTADSVLAGADLEMPGPTRQRGAALVQAVRQGQVPAEAVQACARRVLQLVQRVGGHLDVGATRPAERSDELPSHRQLIRRAGAAGMVLLKNQTPAGGEVPLLPLALRPGQRVAVLGRPAQLAQIMGGGSATVNAHRRTAPLEALARAWPGCRFDHAAGADLHRWLPVLQASLDIAFYDGPAWQGPVVHRASSPSGEQMWFDALPPVLERGAFSARGRASLVPAESGLHQLSLISAGLSRLYLDDVLVVDAWSGWQRGETYFGFGCNEVRAEVTLQAGRVYELTVEFSAVTPEPIPRHAVRIGCHRPLGEADLAQAEALAAQADLALVFVGLNGEWDCEALDRSTLALPHHQDELVRRVVAANPCTVVVLQTGSPVLLPWLAQVPALLQAWYPGQECGDAVADVLAGLAEPGGRLPQTWPASLDQGVAMADAAHYPGVGGHVAYAEGVFIGYRHFQASAQVPAFPFGYGLGYTRFSLHGLLTSRNSFGPHDTLIVRAKVRNEGQRAGWAVPQLYVHDVCATAARPLQELKGFDKLWLAPGETRALQFELGFRSWAWWSSSQGGWLAEAGAFELRLGWSADDIVLRTVVTLTEDHLQRCAAAGCLA